MIIENPGLDLPAPTTGTASSPHPALAAAAGVRPVRRQAVVPLIFQILGTEYPGVAPGGTGREETLP